jgi:hypothetical protein
MGDAHSGDRPPSEVMLVLRQKKAQPLHPLSGASQRSLHNAPIFRLLLKVAVNGTHQCDCLDFCGGLGPQYVSPTCNHLLRRYRAASVPVRPREAWLTFVLVGLRSCCVVSCRFVSFPFMSLWFLFYAVLFCSVLFCLFRCCLVPLGVVSFCFVLFGFCFPALCSCSFCLFLFCIGLCCLGLFCLELL